MDNKKKIILAIIVFIASFVISRAIFSNWGAIKELLFG